MAEDKESKTERATDRRKREARQKGQVAISRDIPTAAVLLGGLTLLYLFIGDGLTNLVGYMRDWMSRAGTAGHSLPVISPDLFRAFMFQFGLETIQLAFPMLLSMMVLGAGSYLVQTGIIWPGKGLKLDPTRLNPITGLGRMFSLRSVVEMIKSVLKVVIITLIGFAAIRNDFSSLPGLVHHDLWSVLTTIGLLMTKLAFWVGLTIAILAIADYAYQRYEWERGLRMTKHEIKEEHREAEGDPLLRSRIRSLQRDISRNRMMADVPKSDVVITNPHHLAVALRYDPARMAAPIVVAKGAGYLAERIKQIAGEHGVKVIENQFVARSLYKLVEVGREIPADLYRAVAEILALVFRARGETIPA